MKQFEIYFDDLNEDTQKALLAFYGVDDVSETVWKDVPIAEICYTPEGKAKSEIYYSQLNKES